MTRQEEAKILAYIDKQEADRKREGLQKMVEDIKEKCRDNRIILKTSKWPPF